MASVDIRYRLTRRDVVVAVAAINRFSKLASVFAAVGVVVTAVAFGTGDPTWPMPALLGAGFATGLLPGMLGAWAWGRRPEIRSAELHLTADATGVRISQPMGSTAADWAIFRRVRETPHAFLLDVGTGAATFVPKAAMSAEAITGLRSLATTAGVLAAGSSWRLPGIGVVVGVLLALPVLALYAGGYIVSGPA